MAHGFGLVCVEADLSFMSRQQAIAFVDPDEPCTLDVRYRSFTLPAGVKKLLISNPDPKRLYPADPHGAIGRRVKTLHITSPTWLNAQNGNHNTPVLYLLTPGTAPTAPV